MENHEDVALGGQRFDSSRRRLIVGGVCGGIGLLLPSLAGCGGGGGGGTVSNNPFMPPLATTPNPPIPTGSAFRPLTKLANASSVRATFQATLVAAPTILSLIPGSTPTTFWAFNGMSPGPLIDVQEGDTVSIAFTNQLVQPSTIHWHGLPVPPDQDGNPMNPVAPGATRTYTFTLPLGCAGTYWYHPHPHETTHEQVFRGLAGCLIVRPAVDPLAGIPDRVLMVTDLRIDMSNQIAANTAQDMTFGREGDHLLVNGVKLPTLNVEPGSTERWRIVNATSARYLRLALAGHELTLVAHDGGLIERPRSVIEFLLAPAQRVEVIVQASRLDNQKFVLTAKPYGRGTMMAASMETSILTLATSANSPVAAIAIPPVLRTVEALPTPIRTQTITLNDSMGMMMGMGIGTGMPNPFLINGKSFDPNRVDLVSRVNDVEDWQISNQGSMDHPFHIHGTQFQLIASNRSDTTPALDYRAWIDTINVRAGEAVRVRIRQTMIGKRMFHCHILEHEDQGMMGVLEVLA